MRTPAWLALSFLLFHSAYDLHLRAETMTNDAIGGIPTTSTPRTHPDAPKRGGAFFGKDVRETVKQPESQAKLAQSRAMDKRAIWYLAGSVLALLIALVPHVIKLKGAFSAQSLSAHSAGDSGCGRTLHVPPTEASGGLRADGVVQSGRPPA
ncbi:hypothetical protein R5W24_000553 [Gemmata sp. JC717]|uniref:hypothetical protein n=1 Tax=Gemmata algarum TaxID=2975278 RepID=UPI0021BAABE3|nr:hypothetical protein [Gemmata algarum]MDY3551477.1 hypothetical protein [Gemmata algarum]